MEPGGDGDGDGEEGGVQVLRGWRRVGMVSRWRLRMRTIVMTLNICPW